MRLKEKREKIWGVLLVIYQFLVLKGSGENKLTEKRAWHFDENGQLNFKTI